jgi:preprotein translocase subunit SecG
MAFIIGLLTVVMVLDCIVLILLVLIQLPKKEAGAGLAFGGTATDALFGAGSGTVLTKITKYAATIFFVLAVFLSMLQSNYRRQAGSQFQKKLEEAGQSPMATLPPSAPAPAAAPPTNASTVSPAESTNAPKAVTAPAAAVSNSSSGSSAPK